MTTQEAIAIIIAANCRPPQIDYVQPEKRRQEQEALKHIYKLPTEEKRIAEKTIGESIDEYYGENGAAQYDKLF